MTDLPEEWEGDPDSDLRPAVPAALDAPAGTYAELLASRDALQDDYNALSDEHDKCPAVPAALDVERLASILDAIDNVSAGYWDRRTEPPVLLTNHGLATAIVAAVRSEEPTDAP